MESRFFQTNNRQTNSRIVPHSAYKLYLSEILVFAVSRCASIAFIHASISFDFLYGAAFCGTALISDADIADDTEFLKELYHETGHAAGLKHCGNYCVMRPAKIPADLSQKPCFLCPACRKMFESAVDHIFGGSFLN